MTAQPDHDEVVRQSFEKQVGLFDGDDALFARRADPAVSWLGPLSPDMIVLDVACGAGHVAETVAPYVRQVVGVDVTIKRIEAKFKLSQNRPPADIDGVIAGLRQAGDHPGAEAVERHRP